MGSRRKQGRRSDVRLFEGEDSQHVLEAIFKALGVALADARPEEDMANKDVISTDALPGPFQGAPYNQAIRVGDLVFVAGQLGIVLESGDLAGETVEEQTERSCATCQRSSRPRQSWTSS